MNLMNQYEKEKSRIRRDHDLSPREKGKRLRELKEDLFNAAIKERWEDCRNIVEGKKKPSDWRG